MAKTRNCPFLDRECEKSDCKMWTTYVTSKETEGTGECALKLLAVMGLPRFGGGLEPDED